MKPDSQLVELIGRSWLMIQLLADGIEVARPERDRGADLIAYLDLDTIDGQFIAYPIQLKASRGFNFGFDRKYEKFPNLLFAFVWGLDDPNTAEAICLTSAEVIGVAEQMGWTTTPSWLGETPTAKRSGPGYSTRHRSKMLDLLLMPYRMKPGGWSDKLYAVAGLPAVPQG